MSAAPILTILKDGEMIKSQPITEESVLGRSEGCLIRLVDRAISRQHAVFRPTAEGLQVEKKSEFAPLVVNGADCTKALLKEGDVISIGPYLMKLSLEKAQVAEIPESPMSEPMLPTAELAPAAQASEAAVELPSLAGDSSVDIAQSHGATREFVVDKDLAGVELSQEMQSPGPSIELSSDADQKTRPVDSSSGDPGQEMELSNADGGSSEAPGSLGLLNNQPGSGMPSPSELTQQVDEDAATRLLPSTRVVVKLQIPEGKANHTEFEITQDEIYIGRGSTCEIILSDKKSSRRNTLIRREGAGWTIKDLASSNGTFVNGLKIHEEELSGDDLIRIGDVEMRFLVLNSDYLNKAKDFMSIPSIAMPAEDSNGVQEAAAAELPDPSLQSISASAQAAPAGDFGLRSQPVYLQQGAALGSNMLSGPGYAGIPGINGVSTKKKGLYDKYIRNFKDLNPRQKVMVVFVVGSLLYLLGSEDEVVVDPSAKDKKAKPVAAASPTPGDASKLLQTFESLSDEQKKFVRAQHALAFEYYRAQDYDKALYEVRKIFALIPDFEDSREIERYALEGKRKAEAREEEKKKFEEQAKLKAQIASLTEEINQLLSKKRYVQARELFAQVLALDPENEQIERWKKDFQLADEEMRQNEQRLEIQKETNQVAREYLAKARALRNKGRYRAAIAHAAKVKELGAVSPGLQKQAAALIAQCRQAIQEIMEPLLAEARGYEEAGDHPKAFETYKKASRVDPNRKEPWAGMSRIRRELHSRAKSLYTEAVLAESYSDFTTAKKKYRECMSVAPEDDIYHQRAQRKLSNYFMKEEAGHAPASDAGTF